MSLSRLLGRDSATSTADLFAYAAPTVTSVSPNAGAAATSVTVTGTNFSPGDTVKFGSTSATGTVTVTSSTTLTVPAPSGPTGSVDITVTNADGTSPVNQPADLFAYAKPTVTLVSPLSGPTAGTPVTITGTGFAARSTVTFDGTLATSIVVVSGTEITAVTPSDSAGTASVLATNADGTTTGSNTLYNYIGPPTVASLSPSAGASGTSVTITGANFSTTAGNDTVDFGSTPATISGTPTASSITATAPPGTGTVAVTVTVAGFGTSATSSADLFAYAAPTVTAVSPTAGSNGTNVTVTGTNFSPGDTVKFGTTAATGTVNVTSSTTLTVPAPSGPTGSVDVTVANADGTSPTSSADLFAYGIPTVTGISPSSGTDLGGTPITITGTGFVPGVTATLAGSALSVTFVSGTTLTAVTPAHSNGFVSVVVHNGNGNSTASNNFDYVTPAASQIVVTGCASVGLGSTCTATATVEDNGGHTFSYSGSGTFAGSSGLTGYGNVTFSSGVAQITLTGHTQGSGTFHATGDSLTSANASFQVFGSISQMALSGCTTVTTGSTCVATATVEDSSGDTVSNFSGSIQFGYQVTGPGTLTGYAGTTSITNGVANVTLTGGVVGTELQREEWCARLEYRQLHSQRRHGHKGRAYEQHLRIEHRLWRHLHDHRDH